MKLVAPPPSRIDGHLHDRQRPALATFALALFFLVVGYYLRRFAFLLPLLLAAAWVVGRRHALELTRRPEDLLPMRLWIALGFYVLALLVSSALAPFWDESLREMLITFAGPLLVALFIGWAMPLEGAGQPILLALLAGGTLIAATDIVHYASEFVTLGGFATDFSHRWRSEGYILYTPFLLLFRDSLEGRRRRIAQAGVLLFFLLAAGTGSRGTWGVILIEIILLGIMLRSRRYLIDFAAFLLAIAAALAILPHELGVASAERGLSDHNRIEGHWKPTLKKTGRSFSRLLVGHGYGSEVLVTLPEQERQSLVQGRGLGGPHNVFLRALFVGGFPALGALMWIFAELGWILWRGRSDPDDGLRRLAIGGFVALAGFYLIAGQVGDQRPEPLALFILLATLLHQCQTAASRSAADLRPLYERA